MYVGIHVNIPSRSAPSKATPSITSTKNGVIKPLIPIFLFSGFPALVPDLTSGHKKQTVNAIKTAQPPQMKNTVRHVLILIISGAKRYTAIFPKYPPHETKMLDLLYSFAVSASVMITTIGGHIIACAAPLTHQAAVIR